MVFSASIVTEYGTVELLVAAAALLIVALCGSSLPPAYRAASIDPSWLFVTNELIPNVSDLGQISIRNNPCRDGSFFTLNR